MTSAETLPTFTTSGGCATSPRIDTANLPTEDPEWQLYTQGLGLHKIAFAGRPDVALSDKLFYVRYGQRDELDDVSGESNNVTDDPGDRRRHRRFLAPRRYSTTTPAPSPAPPAQKSPSSGPAPPIPPSSRPMARRRFVPQLVMGWVKRVLDRVNPYEARYTDFYNQRQPCHLRLDDPGRRQALHRQGRAQL